MVERHYRRVALSASGVRRPSFSGSANLHFAKLCITGLASLHPLAALLQHYVATDDDASKYLPISITILDASALLPSPHRAKWMARVNSLIASKDRGPRWAGVCLASKTAKCSKDLMVEQAAGWVANLLPVMQKQETVSIHLSIITLLNVVFSSATDMPEFMRQVCTPNVPKFSQAILDLADNAKSPLELKIACLQTVSEVLLLYPNAHRALQAAFTATCMSILRGAWPVPTDPSLLHHGAVLLARLSVTGGKVGSAEVWKRTMSGALRVAMDSFLVVRGTSKIAGFSDLLAELEPLHGLPPLPQDPLDALPVALDRLRCMAELINALFRYPAARPVPIPVGPIMQLCILMLESTEASETKEVFESMQRSVELALLPQIWVLGSDIVCITCRSIRIHMMPYASRLQRIIVRQLDRIKARDQVLPFLAGLRALLACCVSPSEDQVTVLIKAVLPLLQISLETMAEPEGTGDSKKTGSKKRNRTRYEGDELFQRKAEQVHVGTVVEVAHIIGLLLKGPSFPLSFRVVTVRYLVNALLRVPHVPLGDSDKASVWEAIWFALDAEWLNKGGTGGIAINLATNVVGSEMAIEAALSISERLERIIHPRLPPVLRNMPTYETLGMRLPEGRQEADLASELGVVDGASQKGASETAAVLSSATVIVQPQPMTSMPGTSTTTRELPPISTSWPVQSSHVAESPSNSMAATPPNDHTLSDAMQVDNVPPVSGTFSWAGRTETAPAVNSGAQSALGAAFLFPGTALPAPLSRSKSAAFASSRPASTSSGPPVEASVDESEGQTRPESPTEAISASSITPILATATADEGVSVVSGAEPTSSVWKGKQPERPSTYQWTNPGDSDDEPLPPLTLDPDTEDEGEEEEEEEGG